MTLAAVRQPNEPMLIGRTWYFPDGGRARLVAGGADDGPLVIEDDLTVIADDDLAALEQQVVDEIDALLDAGSTDVPAMTALAEGVDRIRAERATRAEQAERDAAEIEAIRQRVHPTAAEGDETDPDDGDDPGAGTPPATDGGEGAAPAEERESVTAAGRRPAAPARRPASAAATSRRAARPAVPASQPRVTITAAADLPGVSTGAEIDVTQVAVSMHDRARGLNDGGKAPVGRIHLPYATDQVIGKMTSNEAMLDIIDEASRPSRLMANGLVAAGGWCTPSQNLYDIFTLDGATGLLDLPSVGVDRGGINIPSYIGIEAADGALWTWSEDQDAHTTITITDLDVATGVGTVTNSGANYLNVGDIVELAVSNALMNGPHTVTVVTDATHFTLSMVGVPDATNATGVGTRQKGCFRIPCPTWSDNRLGAYGLCISHGNLTDRAFPELTRRYVNLVLNSHLHRMSSVQLAKIASTVHSDAVTVTATGSDSFGELMSALELSITDYRSQYKISATVPIEVLLPTWTQEVLRSNLAMRAGVDDMLAVTDAQLASHFAARNVRPQFLEDYQPMWNGTARVVWPTTIQFIIYPAGDFIEGNGGTIDLGVTRDSRLNATNDFTAAWTEDFRLLARRGPKARKVTATLDTNGITACCP